MQEVFHEAVNRLEKGESVVVATVIRTKGSTPQKPGAKLLVRQDGTGAGTLGGGCVEGDIWFAAKQLMQQGGEAEYREYELNEELAAEDGLVCGGTMYFLIDPVYTPEDYLPYAREIDFAYKGEGAVALATVIKSGNDGKSRIGDKLFIRENGKTEGTLGNLEIDKGAIEKAKILMIHGRNEYVMTASGAEYFIEAYTTPPQLVICGGGHVSRALASLAKPLEFRLFITDDREGMLVDLSAVFAKNNINIAEAKCRMIGEGPAVNTFKCGIADLKQLRIVVKQLESIKGVHSVERARIYGKE